MATIVNAQSHGANLPLLLPSAIVFDTQGNLYIAETGRHVICRVDRSGQMTTVAGNGIQGYGGDGGAAVSAQLDSPQGVAVNSSYLFIADTHNHRIRRVSLADGTITTIAGNSTAGSSGDQGPATSASLDRPVAMAIDNNGNLVVADSGSHRIRRINADTGTIMTIAGEGTQGYEGDDGQAAFALLDSPQGLAVDAGGNLYLADTHNQRIRRIDAATGNITSVVGTGAFGYAGDLGTASSSKLAFPSGLAIDPEGNLYLADSANHRIRRIDSGTGMITTLVGDGTQGFSGDGGAPVSAALNSPRTVAFSATGLITISDTMNQRIRQVSETSIQTIVGPGAANLVPLILSGDTSISYGSGSIKATLSSSTNALGNIVFTDSASSSVTVPLSVNAAVFDLSHLSAGQHTIRASYGGDATHLATQSSPFTLTVFPLSVAAIITPSSLSYGESIPVIMGSLTGLLSRDQAEVKAVFTLDAPENPSTGNYPVKVALSGSAAGNYTVATLPILTITKARTAVALTATTAASTSASSADAGQPIIFTAHLASATTGVPQGTVSIYDGAMFLTAGIADSSGSLTYTTTALSKGVHNLYATYSGDENYLSSTSTATTFTVNTPPAIPADFTIAPSGKTAQTIVGGSSANYSFTVQVQGDLMSPITLSALGVPDTADVSFNPDSIVPGTSSATFTMTVVTPKIAKVRHEEDSVLFVLVSLPFILSKQRLRYFSGRFLAMISLISLFALGGCGDRIRSGGSPPALAKSYTITVIGTTTDSVRGQISHTAVVTLTVQPQT